MFNKKLCINAKKGINPQALIEFKLSTILPFSKFFYEYKIKAGKLDVRYCDNESIIKKYLRQRRRQIWHKIEIILLLGCFLVFLCNIFFLHILDKNFLMQLRKRNVMRSNQYCNMLKLKEKNATKKKNFFWTKKLQSFFILPIKIYYLKIMDSILETEFVVSKIEFLEMQSQLQILFSKMDVSYRSADQLYITARVDR